MKVFKTYSHVYLLKLERNRNSNRSNNLYTLFQIGLYYEDKAITIQLKMFIMKN